LGNFFIHIIDYITIAIFLSSFIEKMRGGWKTHKMRFQPPMVLILVGTIITFCFFPIIKHYSTPLFFSVSSPRAGKKPDFKLLASSYELYKN